MRFGGKCDFLTPVIESIQICVLTRIQPPSVIGILTLRCWTKRTSVARWKSCVVGCACNSVNEHCRIDYIARRPIVDRGSRAECKTRPFSFEAQSWNLLGLGIPRILKLSARVARQYFVNIGGRPILFSVFSVTPTSVAYLDWWGSI